MQTQALAASLIVALSIAGAAAQSWKNTAPESFHINTQVVAGNGGVASAMDLKVDSYTADADHEVKTSLSIVAGEAQDGLRPETRAEARNHSLETIETTASGLARAAACSRRKARGIVPWAMPTSAPPAAPVMDFPQKSRPHIEQKSLHTSVPVSRLGRFLV